MANPKFCFIAILLIYTYSSCKTRVEKQSPIVNYLRAKSVTISDTTTVIVSGCVACSARPYDVLDSILTSAIEGKCQLLYITTDLEESLSSSLRKQVHGSPNITVIHDEKNTFERFGIYHKNPKIFVVTKDFKILLKQVINH